MTAEMAPQVLQVREKSYLPLSKTMSNHYTLGTETPENTTDSSTDAGGGR